MENALMKKLAIGLMSGTSMDGIDTALVSFEVDEHHLELLAFETYPYPEDVQQKLRQLTTWEIQDYLYMNVLLGNLFSTAVKVILETIGISPAEITCIGSHGQTIYHMPTPDFYEMYNIAGSWQIGDGSVIAQRTKITTVCDFRMADMAVGGQGAPLVPYFDWWFFCTDRPRILLNIGGIANLTHLPANADILEVKGFDTGPGNMVLDKLVEIETDGRLQYDAEGKWAAKGDINHDFLQHLLENPYFDRQPSKSTGAEDFGQAYAIDVLHNGRYHYGLCFEDILATITSLTSKSIALSILRFIETQPVEVIASGGGVHNATLMTFLARDIAPIQLKTTDEFGIPSDAKEAIAFALLGLETIEGKPTNMPVVTGAWRHLVQGKICPK